MNYSEALNKKEQNKKLIGTPLGDYKVAHLIITTDVNLVDVVLHYLTYGFDNKAALVQFGLLNSDDLELYAFPPRYVGSGFFSKLK